jgi:hypothetical protein
MYVGVHVLLEVGQGKGVRGRVGANLHGLEDSSHHRLAGGIVANFVWLLVTSLLLGGAAGLVVASALKRLKLQGAHQVGRVSCSSGSKVLG